MAYAMGYNDFARYRGLSHVCALLALLSPLAPHASTIVAMAEYPEGEFLLPLFPLPNLVFFPGTRMPLHIFEPRYRALMRDVLTSDERFGIVLPRPGWESDYEGAPPLHEYGTMALVEQSVALDDGRYNILVRGVVRVRIIEFVSEKPYRVARVTAEPEKALDPMQAWAQRTWLVELSQRYLELLPGGSDVPELSSARLDALTNALVMSLQLDAEEKQRLLEMSELRERAEAVGAILGEKLQVMELLAPFRNGESDPSLN